VAAVAAVATAAAVAAVAAAAAAENDGVRTAVCHSPRCLVLTGSLC
jgi:hypothetical protein